MIINNIIIIIIAYYYIIIIIADSIIINYQLNNNKHENAQAGTSINSNIIIIIYSSFLDLEIKFYPVQIASNSDPKWDVEE